MEEVKQIVQEEGREARNLVAFHVAVDSPARLSRKPPRSATVAASAPRRTPPRPSASRLRSASAGRDKLGDLKSRYWALLFGDLQRSVGELYNTVEFNESITECQEVILVLENYTRDFRGLCEWFRLKWAYDNTPPPQRPQSLAWDIRKTDFVRPESRRAHSVKSSPSVSGKNSPSLSGSNTPSGKNSPNLTTGKTSPGSEKLSPRVAGHAISPKANLEFFSNKFSVSKVAIRSEPKMSKDKLSDIKEKASGITSKIAATKDKTVTEIEPSYSKEIPIIEIGTAKECPNISAKPVIVKTSPKHSRAAKKTNTKEFIEKLSNLTLATVSKLDIMECEFLEKQLLENAIKNENMLNQDKAKELVYTEPIVSVEVNSEKENIQLDDKAALEKETPSQSPTKSEDNFADVSDESSHKSDVEVLIVTADVHLPRNDTINCNTPKQPSTRKPEVDLKVSADDEIVSEATLTERAEYKQSLKTDLINHTKCVSSQEIIFDSNDGLKDKEGDKKEPDSKKPPLEIKPNARPAYSQAAAKPKVVSSLAKVDTKSNGKAVLATRSKTSTEIRTNTALKTQKSFPKKNQTNKCSYPFNLTTGRTSLFDNTPLSKPQTFQRKPLARHIQLGSGDIKPKNEVKKPAPKIATSFKDHNTDDNKTSSHLKLENIKDCDEYSSSDTIITQIDMSRIESSESLKTLVSEDLIGNSIEVLNIDDSKNDNEGWLTVKSRRLSRESKKQSKSHWANRFNQPSATTSLPTLNMIESSKQETNPIVISKANFDRAKSEQPQEVRTPEKISHKLVKKKSQLEKSTAVLRQKSDVTGLKTRSSRNKAASKKSDRNKDASKSEESEQTKNRLHSSLESLTGTSWTQESVETPFDFDKWKAEFISSLKYEQDEEDQISDHSEILKTADPSEQIEINAMTSEIEANERKISLALDFQSEVDCVKLTAEENLLNKQIKELENEQASDGDVGVETDDTETDAELPAELYSARSPSPEVLGATAASLEDQYSQALAGMSWAERVDTLSALEALVARHPGRAQQLHAKLSQGIKRRGSIQDALRTLQAKQARAENQRLELQLERSRKIHTLLDRVEEVKVAKYQVINEKRIRMERRLAKAAEKRDQHLKDRVRKAHDEEEKLREIAFIKQMNAENRRHEFLHQCRMHNQRLRLVRRERLDKLQQKAAREAAVGARRQALEEARRLHVETLLEKKKERDARVEEKKEQKKQERDDAAREKAEGVKSRLSALAAAAELETVALRSRIRDKQDASQQRLATHLQAIRIKAGPRHAASTSESHEKEPFEEISPQEAEKREKDRQRALRKRARKLRQKLIAAGQHFEENEPRDPLSAHLSHTKPCKLLNQLNNILSNLVENENRLIANKKDSLKLTEITNGNGKANENGDDNTKKDDILTDKPVCNENHTYSEKKKNKRNKKAASEEKLVHSKEKNNNSNPTANGIDMPVTDKNVKEYGNKLCENDKKYCSSELIINNNDVNQNELIETEDTGSVNGNSKCYSEVIIYNNAINENHENDTRNGTVLTRAERKKARKMKNRADAANSDKYKNDESQSDKNMNGFAGKIVDNKLAKAENNKEDSNNSKHGEHINIKKGNGKNKNAKAEYDKPNIENAENILHTNDKAEDDKHMNNKDNKHTTENDKLNNEKPTKLRKTASVASSMSDMSKMSSKSDKKGGSQSDWMHIDWPQIDKILSEIFRAIHKFDRNCEELLYHSLKIVNQLLYFCVGKDDIGIQAPTKSLTNAVQLLMMILTAQSSIAPYFLNTNGAVYLAQLLTEQLNKDLDDKNELQLAKLMADCYSIAADSVLVATRKYEESKEKGKQTEPDVPNIITTRQRVNGLISYLCLSGCVHRAEKAGTAREGVQTLLNVFVDLLQPSELDTGSERSTAIMNLRAAFAGSDLCGSRTELCSLFARGASLAESGGFVRAARTAHLLRAVAELDVGLVQEAFGEGRFPLEFRASVARLLSQHAPSDKEAPRRAPNYYNQQRLDQSLSETMVMDLIVLVGFVVVNNPQLQETILSGWSAVKTVCTLPANWIVSPRHRHALLPTLAALAQYPPAKEIVQQEISLEVIEDYMKGPDATNVKLAQLINEAKAKKTTHKTFP